MASQSSLTSDIQRVLQNAVTHALDNTEVLPKQKKRKRHDSGPAEGGAKDKKRKHNKKSRPEKPQNLAAGDFADGLSTTKDISTADNIVKKNKEKGKKRAEIPVNPSPQDGPSSSQGDSQNLQQHQSASTAAFLSALLAAASATPDSHPDMHTQQTFDSQFSPSYPNQLSQYSSMTLPPFPYPASNFVDQANPFSGMPSLPELASNANEEIMRSLQDVDITKLQSVLRTLGEAAASAQMPPNLVFPPGFMDVPPQILPSPAVKQNPVPSYAILGQEPKNAEPPKAPTWEQYGNPAHAEMLATKWMNAAKLAELVKSEGLVYHKGKFSEIEQSQLKLALENYRNRNGLSPEQLNEIIFSKDKAKDKDFWSEITCSVPLRPIIAVYHYVRRAYHPLKGQGKWTADQDTLLQQAVNEYGQQWERVSEQVGRMASDCRDRYRNHLADKDLRNAGMWSKEEENELTSIVTEMTVDQGKNMDNDIFWGVVSQRMGNRRGRQQCRIKWVDSLSKSLKNEGERPRWTSQDAYILVHKIDSLNVRHDTEVDWKTLPDPDWNLWSPHILQRRWTTMKRGIKGHENMSHQEIMDILRVKKAANLPSFSISLGLRKQFKSSEMVPDDADGSDLETRPLVGASTGPGTLASKARRKGDDESISTGDSEEE